MKLHNNYWEYPWKKLFSHFWKFPPTKSVFLHLLHGWIDWKMIVNSHNIDCNKKESLHCRWLCLSCAWQVSPGCACLFLNVAPSHHKLYLISRTNTYNHTHFDAFAPYQTQVVQSCMMGVVCCSCLWVQCSRELELFRGTRQRSEGRPLCSTPQQHNKRRNSFLMSLLRSV